MSSLKLAIIGAGSSYTPEILAGLAGLREELPVAQMDCYDTDPARMETVVGFCRRYANHLGLPLEIHTCADRREAIAGADFVITQIRVGGNKQRAIDERISLRHGVIGQETTGPVGMFKALRTIPAMLEIARDMEEVNPRAWLINYANPTGILAEAVLRYSKVKMLSLCAGGARPRWTVASALNVPAERVDHGLFGLNHCHFAYDITVNGQPLTDAEFDIVAEHAAGSVDADLIKALRLIPSGYMQYYFHRDRMVKRYLERGKTRGEEVLEIEKEVFAAYADPNQVTKPEVLARRGGGGYAGIALGVIDAIHNDTGRVFVVNTLNRGASPYLPADASLEMPCVIGAAGAKPLSMPALPGPIWGLIAAVKNYEQLTVEAAVTGSHDTARLALLAHPLVGDWEKAKGLFVDLMEANREYLNNFH
jgi:6-phospho-beta-glucosidase